MVYQSWLASRPDLSPKVRRGYEDNWRFRVEPKFGKWPIGRICEICPGMGQRNDRTGLSPDCAVDAFRAADDAGSCHRGPEAARKESRLEGAVPSHWAKRATCI